VKMHISVKQTISKKALLQTLCSLSSGLHSGFCISNTAVTDTETSHTCVRISLIQRYSSPRTPRVHTADCDDGSIWPQQAISTSHMITVPDDTMLYDAADAALETPSNSLNITVSISDDDTAPESPHLVSVGSEYDLDDEWMFV